MAVNKPTGDEAPVPERSETRTRASSWFSSGRAKRKTHKEIQRRQNREDSQKEDWSKKEEVATLSRALAAFRGAMFICGGHARDGFLSSRAPSRPKISSATAKQPASRSASVEKPPVSTPAAAAPAPEAASASYGVSPIMTARDPERSSFRSAIPTIRGSGLPCSTSSPQAVAAINSSMFRRDR